MDLIVAVDKNWGIGLKGELLISISEDHKRFKEITTGNVVVMGRKTLLTLPGSKPLKNRVNIVLSRDEDLKIEGAIVYHSITEFLESLKDHSPGRGPSAVGTPPGEEKKVYVIGGQDIYEQLLPHCKKAYITKVEKEFEADSYFPDLDADEKWRMVNRSETRQSDDIFYYYIEYENIQHIQ